MDIDPHVSALSKRMNITETAAQVEARIRARKETLLHHIVKISDDLKDQASSSMARIADKVEQGVDTVKETLETRVESVSSKLEHGVTQVSDTLHEGIHKFSDQVDQTVAQAKAAVDIKAHVQAQPFLAVGVAVGVGYLVKKAVTADSHGVASGAAHTRSHPPEATGPSALGTLFEAFVPMLAMAAQTYLSHAIKRRFSDAPASPGEV